MATASQFYNQWFAGKLRAEYTDLETASAIKVALVTSSYDMATATTGGADADNGYADIDNEVTGTGYTGGGAVLPNVSVTQDDTNDRGSLDAEDLTWSTGTFTARGCILYNDAATSPVADALICYIDFGADKTVSAADFTIQWHADGIFYEN